MGLLPATVLMHVSERVDEHDCVMQADTHFSRHDS